MTIQDVERDNKSCRMLMAEHTISCVSRIISGVVLIFIAYLVVEQYRQHAAYDNIYLERRLDRIAGLWAATDRHGIEVLKLLAMERVDTLRFRALGEAYYLELASAGVFLGEKRINSIRNRVGDIFLAEHEAKLGASKEVVRAQIIREFRANWRMVLADLEELGAIRDK
jgi:hypothetical protein